MPGVVFGFVDWKKSAAMEPPTSYLYLGEYRRQVDKGVERMVETFFMKPSPNLYMPNPDRECRNVRTIMIIIRSHEEVSDKFIKGLDLQALNRLIAER